MPACKTIYPSRGWLRVLWPKELAGDFYRRCSATDVPEIPGCKLTDGYLDVPYTAWMLEPVIALLEELGARVPPETDGGYIFARVAGERTLYAHQEDGAGFILTRVGTVLADEMGVGKTCTAAVAAAAVAQQHSRPALIIGTLAVQQTWRRELQALGFINEPTDWCALESRDIDDKSFRRKAKWYFVHFEVVKAWWSMIYMERPCVVIIDEAHYVRNSKTQRSSGAALAVSGSIKRVLLTGTPVENRPSDLYNLLSIACGPKTWGYAGDFRKRYCGAEHNGYALVDTGPTNVAELRARLSTVYLRRTTEDAGIDLPEFVRTTHTCALGKYEAEYNAIVDGLGRFELGELDALVRMIAEGAAQKVLPELTRLRQLTSRAKVAATREYVINALEQGEAVVVFAWERDIAAQIFNGLGDFAKILAHGGLAQRDRDAAIDAFQASKDPVAMITTYGAMREGVTLHRARICVLHDLDWTLSSMLQAEKRIHRLGQKRSCQAVWMLAEKSMDTLIAPILLRKADLMTEILGIRHDIRDDIGLTELAGRKDADAMIAQAFAAWDGARNG